MNKLLLPLCLFHLFTLQLMAQSFVGSWQGVLEVQGIKLRLVFHISQTDGQYTSLLDSPDQGATGIPTSETRVAGDSLFISADALRLAYRGKLAAGGKRISGTFSQGSVVQQLELERTGEAELAAAAPKRPQEPRPPFPYLEEEVQFQNEAAGIQLAGTLTLPKGPGPHRVAVLISGSGPQNRDEEILGHKPFLVLADHLTRAGIGVLRFDDRGVGASEGDFASATSADFATDVEAAVAYLRNRPEVNPQQIGLIGHSEGGLIAPMVAAKDPAIAFVVLMAGPGLSGYHILLQQVADINRANGMEEQKVKQNVKTSKKLYKIIMKSASAEAAREKALAFMKKEMAKLSDEEKAQIGDPEKFMQQQLAQLNSPWFRYFLSYDPRPALRQLSCPVLAINGSKDTQVHAGKNLKVIESALRKSASPHYTVKELPGLNHLFQTAETGAPTEYAQIEETMAPIALETIAEWILALAKT